MTDKNYTKVELDELLAAEYSYIAQTAIQAFEDRARVSSFYLIAVGSLIATLFGAQLFDPNDITQAFLYMFAGIFVLLTLLGLSTVIQLAQLRSAWYESMLAMNQIKDFAMDQSPELANAFRWKTTTLPAKYKAGNVSYYQAREVSIISGLMFGAAIFFLQQAIFFPSTSTWVTWTVSVLFAALAVLVQMSVFKKLLT